MSNKTLIGIVAVAALGIAGTLFLMSKITPIGPGGLVTDPNATTTPFSTGIKSVRIERPNFVMIGKDIAQASVWFVPTGTGITRESHQKAGDMVRGGMEEGLEKWTLGIPKEPFLATRLYIVATSTSGRVQENSFTQTGATEIYDALWMASPSKEQMLSPGESMSYDDLKLTFDRVESDNRCPAGTRCIREGELFVVVSVTSANTAGTEAIKLDSSKEGVPYDGYFISITSIAPPAPTVDQSDYTKYEVTFKIEKDTKQ